MLRIALQSLRARTLSLAGAAIAIFLASAFVYATGLLTAGALDSPGAGRFAKADLVVTGDPTVTMGSGQDKADVDVAPSPSLPASLVNRAGSTPGVETAIGDIAFPVSAAGPDGTAVSVPDGDGVAGHGWDSAALTPYEILDGEEPVGPSAVVVDSRLGVKVGAELVIASPAATNSYEVSGVASAPDLPGRAQAGVFFDTATAATLAARPDRVNAIGVVADGSAPVAQVTDRLADELGPGVRILDHGEAADADAGDPGAGEREILLAVFACMGGIAIAISLFVVSGAFSLGIAQRAKETAAMRALGAAPRQIRRLIAVEALILSLVAAALGILAGGPLASRIADWVVDRGDAPRYFAPGDGLIPALAAVGSAVLIAQLSVAAAAWRAGRVRPAAALREVTIEHPRPGVIRMAAGLLCLGGGGAMALIFTGQDVVAFSVLTGLLLAIGVGLLGRWLLGLPATLLARPLRALGPAGLIASTGIAANRWRVATLATPVMLIVVLAGTQGLLQGSDQDNTRAVSAERLTADQVVAGRNGGVLPPSLPDRVAALPTTEATARTMPTEVFLLDEGLENADSSWAGAGYAGSTSALDPGFIEGGPNDVNGEGVAVSEVVADAGNLEPGDVVAAKLADTSTQDLTVTAIFKRAAGLGEVLLDPSLVSEHSPVAVAETIFVRETPDAGSALPDALEAEPTVEVVRRSEFLGSVEAANQEESWGVWLSIGLVILFCGLAMLNTAAMAAGERRAEVSSIRTLGGTRSQLIRTFALETALTTLVGLAAGLAIVLAASSGASRGLTGFELAPTGALVVGLVACAALLGLAATMVTSRRALRD